jgi:hypothetical protein
LSVNRSNVSKNKVKNGCPNCNKNNIKCGSSNDDTYVGLVGSIDWINIVDIMVAISLHDIFCRYVHMLVVW